MLVENALASELIAWDRAWGRYHPTSDKTITLAIQELTAARRGSRSIESTPSWPRAHATREPPAGRHVTGNFQREISMTPIQRRACLALSRIGYGRNPAMLGAMTFGNAMLCRGERGDWRSIEFTDRQLHRLAKHIRKFRRQIGEPNLLFWSQRVLAEACFFSKEEPCQQP